MPRKKIKVMLTAFRDGFQSVYGARVFTKDFIHVVKAAREAGITHFEAGGGARFQSLYFYCNENAFDMMDAFRKNAGPDANLQTLARGINVVALDSQPRDIIDLHAKMFKKHGMTTIRNFDALNDVNNLIYSGQAITNAGLKHEVVITMMSLPPGSTGAHDTEFYINMLKKILNADIPFDSLCFKDASGTATPKIVFDTIKQAKKIIPSDKKVVFHTHSTAGIGVICYNSAIQAGVDQVDLSMAPVSGGTSQPDISTIWHCLRNTEYELDIDIDKIMPVEDLFKQAMANYFMPPEAKTVEPMIPWSPMPGGALTANTQMLRDNNIMDKYPEIITAMGEVVKLGGFGTSVTPVSQFYFQQAFNNVMFGKWKKIADGYGKMVLGYFGKTPIEPDAEIVKIASEKLNLPPTKESPLDLAEADPKKGIKPAIKKLEDANLPVNDENIFIVAACEDKGISYLKGEAKSNVRKIGKSQIAQGTTSSDNNSQPINISIDGKHFNVKLSDDSVIVNGQNYNYKFIDSKSKNISTPESGKSSPNSQSITAPMPGNVIKILKKQGDSIQEGEVILIIEAMKMEMEINASSTGVIGKINVNVGDQVQANDTLVEIN